MREGERGHELSRGALGALNIGEGGAQPGKRRMRHYRIAMGSAREAWSVVRGAHAARYIAAPSGELTNKFNHVIGTLHRCVVRSG